MHTPILIALACYGLFMFGMSLFWMLRVKKAVDFLMGGRGLPFWVQIGTLTATGIGTGVTVGAAGLAYKGGWAGSVYPIGLGVGVIVAGLMFYKMRRYQFMTLSEEIASYYGGNRVIYEFSNIALFLSQIFWMTVQILGGGFVLSVITGLPPKTCMVITGALIATTALPGGLLTVVYTDVLQAIILMIGFIVLTVIALGEEHGLAGIRERVPETYFSMFGYKAVGAKMVVGIFSALALSILADPGRRLIMYSGKSEKGGLIAMLVAGVLEIFFSVLVVIVGMYAYTLNPSIEAQDQALPWLVTEVLPTWLSALVVIAITAAIFSSGNTNAATAGTYFMRHIYPMIFKKYPQKPLLVIRLTMGFVFISATSLALFAGDIVSFVVDFLSVLLSGVVVLVVVGRFWKRATWQGGLASLIVAAVVSLTVMYVPSQAQFWGKSIIPATLAGLIAHIVVSLMTPKNTISFESVVEKMKIQRQGLDTESSADASDALPE